MLGYLDLFDQTLDPISPSIKTTWGCSGVEAIASRLEAIASRAEAIASRAEAIAMRFLLLFGWSPHSSPPWR